MKSKVFCSRDGVKNGEFADVCRIAIRYCMLFCSTFWDAVDMATGSISACC